jgi:hypothetical protein
MYVRMYSVLYVCVWDLESVSDEGMPRVGLRNRDFAMYGPIGTGKIWKCTYIAEFWKRILLRTVRLLSISSCGAYNRQISLVFS